MNGNWPTIAPVFKKGDQHYVENYQPISLLCCILKILERCVLSKLRDHLLTLIILSQHGFIPGKSCTAQLLEALGKISSLLDSEKQSDVILLDMSKAFDKVNHTLLINKLGQYNISESLLNWFSAYLYGQQQRVTVLGAMLSSRPISSGMPQGSIVGLILFLFYANDLQMLSRIQQLLVLLIILRSSVSSIQSLMLLCFSMTWMILTAALQNLTSTSTN